MQTEEQVKAELEKAVRALVEIQRDVDMSSPAYVRAWKIAEAAIVEATKEETCGPRNK